MSVRDRRPPKPALERWNPARLFVEPDWRHERFGYDEDARLIEVGHWRWSARAWVGFIVVAVAACALIVGVVAGVAGWQSFNCHRELTNRGLEGHFDVLGEGCYVHMDDGRVLPLDDVKPTQIELDTREGADS